MTDFKFYVVFNFSWYNSEIINYFSKPSNLFSSQLGLEKLQQLLELGKWVTIVTQACAVI